MVHSSCFCECFSLQPMCMYLSRAFACYSHNSRLFWLTFSDFTCLMRKFKKCETLRVKNMHLKQDIETPSEDQGDVYMKMR